MRANNTFKMTGGLRPSRSVFDLSHEVKLTCDMGQLIPIMSEELVPGDTFKLGNQIVIRMQPLVAPIMHEINAYIHYFFVPYRLLWSSWEDFITGGKDGSFTTSLPTHGGTVGENGVGSLWDYLGFPPAIAIPTNQRPLAFPMYAYNMIYNEYYRDENLTDEIALSTKTIQNRSWEKDYFTSALPWQQRGTAPSLPISGLTSAEWLASDFATSTPDVTGNIAFATTRPTSADDKMAVKAGDSFTNAINFFNNNVVDLSSATTFNVSDLRLAFQIQKFLERNARAGARYKEFLGEHFGYTVKDDRLQRPEYVGGTKSRVIVSEVLQTSSTDATSPQANMAGHGITADAGFAGTYTAPEFGVIMGILSIMPKPAYSQGVDRTWLRRTRYDYYFPEFANLSEQAIRRQEIYASTVEAENNTIFGYQGRYDEMRYRPNRVCALMRTDFDYWHMGRIFTAAPELNDTFVKCVPTKRVFAVPTEPGCIVQVGNLIKAIRPLPIMAEPGLIDHH